MPYLGALTHGIETIQYEKFTLVQQSAMNDEERLDKLWELGDELWKLGEEFYVNIPRLREWYRESP